MKPTFIILLSLCSVSLTAQNLIGNKQDLDIILKNIKSFSEHVVASNYDAIMNAYTKDGKIMPSGPPIIEGHEAIKERWTLPENVSIIAHKIIPEEIRVEGGYAYDFGYYEGATKRADGSEVSWRGKYVIIWRKVEDDWKIYVDIWNRVSD